MSDTESFIKLPWSPFLGGEAEFHPSGPLISVFEGIPRGFDVLGIGEAAMADQ